MNKLFLNYWCDSHEKFYGFGSQFTHFNMKGYRVPIIVAEQGIGRGSQPTTFLLNFFGDGAGGDSTSTYAPKPLYFSNYLRSMVVLSSGMMYFDMRDDDSVVLEISAMALKLRIINGEDVKSIVRSISEITGRMSPLPAWTQEGAIIGLEGGTDEVLGHMQELLQPEYQLPIAAVWLQDWVGLRNAYDGDRLLWNWRLDSSYYPNWEQMVRSWAELGIRVLTYINPFFSADPRSYRRNSTSEVRDIFREGFERGYYLYPHDDHEQPYILHSGSIEFHMLDVSNPDARRWMIDIIKTEMIQNSLSSGWMADFAEYAPFDASPFNLTCRLDDSKEACPRGDASYHNLYPHEWAKINRQAIIEATSEGLFAKRAYRVNKHSYRQHFQPKCRSSYKPIKSSSVRASIQPISADYLFFMRSGWLQSPGVTSSYWLGDQLVSWDKYDGIKSAVVGMLSSGISGCTLTHADIGGYTMQERGPYPHIRSKELLYRWIELSSFGSALFRTHIGSSCNPVHQQIYSDSDTIKFFARFASIFSALRCYRQELMQQAAVHGYPLIRPMSFHHSYNDPSAAIWDMTSQYMFGEDFLISPVLDPMVAESIWPYAQPKPITDEDDRKVKVQVYLPAGISWTHLWTGRTIHLPNHQLHADMNESRSNGDYISLSAPLGYPAVFYRNHSMHGRQLREFVISKDWHACAAVAERTDHCRGKPRIDFLLPEDLKPAETRFTNSLTSWLNIPTAVDSVDAATSRRHDAEIHDRMIVDYLFTTMVAEVEVSASS
jgi:sulfoquinovosidase